MAKAIKDKEKLDLSPFGREVYDAVKAAPPGIWATVPGADQTMATEQIYQICKRKKFGYLRWSPAGGLHQEFFGYPESVNLSDFPNDRVWPRESLVNFLRVLAGTEPKIPSDWPGDRPYYVLFVMQMADRVFSETVMQTQFMDAIAKLSDYGPAHGVFPIYLSKGVKYPNDFLGRFISVTWPGLGDEDVMNRLVRPQIQPGELDESDDNLAALFAACKGMPSEFISTTLGRSLERHKRVVPGFFAQEKAKLLASQLGITIQEPKTSYKDLGGLEGVKQHVLKSLHSARLSKTIVAEADKEESLRDNARLERTCKELAEGRGAWAEHPDDAVDIARTLVEFPPRGVLLYGVEGSGKSALAKATAGELGIPLVSLQVSDFLNKFVGSSEENFKAILDFVDKVSPAVFFIDEIEKLFAGASNPNGSGVESHIQGQYLSWAEEQRSGAYILSTCNNVEIFVQSPELIRSGRCDGVFFFDVPTKAERDKIWDIYRAKFRVPSHFETPESTGWTGANIAECCRKALENGVSLTDVASLIRPPTKNEKGLKLKQETAVAQHYLSAATGGIYKGPTRASAPLSEGNSRPRQITRSSSN
jgi:hypothetical protein